MASNITSVSTISKLLNLCRPSIFGAMQEVVRRLSNLNFSEKSYSILTDSNTAALGTDITFVTQAGASKNIVIPQAVNCPGKIYIGAFNHAGGGALIDDASSPNTIIADADAKVGFIVYSTGNASLGTSGWMVFKFTQL